ncbi:MAG: hypothetical protein FH749_12580 [Firmicutes bacterium]|nr:hypothetical protein [Bacillota bacterium]
MKKNLDELLYAYGKATRFSPPDELIERTTSRLRKRKSLKLWLLLAAALGLPLLYAPFVILIVVPMPTPQLLLFISATTTFYNALIAVMWLTRTQLSKLAKEVL